MTVVELDPAELDPGIRDLVVALRASGYDTTDSGDGVSKEPGPCVLPWPHVAIVLPNPDDLAGFADDLEAWLKEHGYLGWTVEASYSTRDGVALLLAEQLPPEAP